MRISDWSSDVCSSDLPRLGAAEAFMDGEMELVEGDIMELIALIRMNTPWDRGAKLLDKGWFGRRAEWVTTRIGSINRQRRSRANVKHHYDIGNDLYRSEEHTSELQSLMRISYAVFCLKK